LPTRGREIADRGERFGDHSLRTPSCRGQINHSHVRPVNPKKAEGREKSRSGKRKGGDGKREEKKKKKKTKNALNPDPSTKATTTTPRKLLTNTGQGMGPFVRWEGGLRGNGERKDQQEEAPN